MSKITIIDPPNGWRFGFPKPIPNGIVKSESLLRIWLMGEGYPAGDVDLALQHSRYWEQEVKD